MKTEIDFDVCKARGFHRIPDRGGKNCADCRKELTQKDFKKLEEVYGK